MKNNQNTDLATIVDDHPLAIIYFSQPNCSICLADKPRVKKLAETYTLPFYTINILDAPAIAANFSVMTVPVVLLVLKGKEVHREARIIDFRRFEKQIQRYRSASTSDLDSISYADLFDQLDERQ